MFRAAGHNQHGIWRKWSWRKGFLSVTTLEWKKCASLPQLVQKLIKCPVKNCLLPFLYCWSCRSSPPTDSCKTHTNPCAQCFQIWQVSARYCTFLDFLAHCWLIFPSCTCQLSIYVLMTVGYVSILSILVKICTN